MKKIIIAAVLASILPVSFAMAEGSPDGKMKHQERQDRFAQELGLTDAQKTQIEGIKAKYNADRKSEMEEIHKVLTPEQQAKAKEMREKHKERFKHAKGDAPKPPVAPKAE